MNLTLEPETDVSPRPGRWERASGARRWSSGALFSLVYVAFFAIGVLRGEGSVGQQAVSLVLLLAMSATYVVLPGISFGASAGTRWAVLALIVLLIVPQLPLMGADNAVGLFIFPGVASGLLLPTRQSIGFGVATAVAMVLLTIGAPGGPQFELAVTEAALAFWMAGFARNIRLNQALRATRDELARAAVLAERERIGRDLHDILGHSLTAITVKAGLARRLADRAPDRVPAGLGAEVRDIEQLARSALADVRATASGIREVSLAGELAAARSVLTAADIRLQAPGAVDDVGPAGRELFGYVVKEAVTNVVRHSGASSCTVRLGSDWVEINDDGRGRRPAVRGGPLTVGDGSGLRGLQERVTAAGGTLSARSVAPSGFSVRVELAPVPATQAGGAKEQAR